MLVDERLESIGERMASAARELQDEHDPAATVNSAVDLLVQNVEECDAASISLVYAKRRVETPDVIGALSMYSTEVDAFSDEDKAEGLALAAHIAIAVIAAQKLDQYESALDSRTIIAQACGLVMERYNVDAVRAFALLTRVSSHQNVKLREVAAELVLTRVLP